MPSRDEQERLRAITALEREYWQRGLLVGGMDEVGRGPLAGPVVAACVILPHEPLIPGVRDSKKVTSEARREALFEAIAAGAVSLGVGRVEETVIDEINILQATRRAFRLAYEAMPVKPEHVLVDALEDLDIPAQQHAYVHGDGRSYLIGAASLYAKVFRDRLMREYDREYPQYGFARNKGYGTAEHMAALREYGPCPIHRRSFLKSILGGGNGEG